MPVATPRCGKAGWSTIAVRSTRKHRRRAYAAEIESERDAGVTHRRRKQLREGEAKRPIRQTREAEAEHQKREHRPARGCAKQRLEREAKDQGEDGCDDECTLPPDPAGKVAGKRRCAGQRWDPSTATSGHAKPPLGANRARIDLPV